MILLYTSFIIKYHLKGTKVLKNDVPTNQMKPLFPIKMDHVYIFNIIYRYKYNYNNNIFSIIYIMYRLVIHFKIKY